MFVYPHAVLHIKLLLSHERCTENALQTIVLSVQRIVQTSRCSVGRCGVNLYALLLTYIHIAIRSVERKPIDEMPFENCFNAQHALIAKVGVFKVILHVVDVPHAFNLFPKEIAIRIHVHKEAIGAVFRTHRYIMVFLGTQLFITTDLKHAEMIPIKEQLFDARCPITHGIIGTKRPLLVQRVLGCELGHPHKTKSF